MGTAGSATTRRRLIPSTGFEMRLLSRQSTLGRGLVLAMTLGLLLAACAGSSSPSPAASAGPANLVDDLLLRNSSSVGVYYFWDVLAATTLVDPAVVTTEEAHVDVTTDGSEAGRTTRADDGALVSLATAADAPAFEAEFLEALRAGGPRQSSFEVTGELKIAFDGTTCSADAPEMLAAGTYQLPFANRSDVPAVAVVGGLVEGSTYDDLDAYLRDHPGSIDQPPMIVVHGFVYLEPGQAGTGLAELAPGDGFVVCLVTATGQERVVDGPRFAIK